ncbi:MAG: DMT family transporter [Armatimonadota bacterium]|nr:DMT family transporter [Armatimonadota bacterium]
MDRSDAQPLTRAAGYLAALLTGTAMGIAWPLQKYILSQQVIGPATLHWLNVCGLLALVAPVYLLRYRGRLRWRGFSPAWLVLFGGVASVMHYCRKYGLAETSATTAAVVERSEVVFVFLFSYLALRTPVRRLGWLGTALVLYGTTRVALVGSTALHFQPLGVVALVVVGLTIAINALLVKAKFTGIPNELIILGSMAVQITVYSIVVPASGALPSVRELLTMPVLIGLVGLGSVVWGTRLLLYYYALKRAPMWAVRMLTLSGLPVATLADLLVLRAPVTWAHVEGLVAAGAGAAMVVLSADRREEQAAMPSGTADGSH